MLSIVFIDLKKFMTMHSYKNMVQFSFIEPAEVTFVEVVLSLWHLIRKKIRQEEKSSLVWIISKIFHSLTPPLVFSKSSHC